MMSYFGSANLPKRRLPLISSDSGVVNLRNIPFLENRFSPSTFLRRQMYCGNHRNTPVSSLTPEIPPVKIISHAVFPPVPDRPEDFLHSQILSHDTGSPRNVHPDSMSARIPYADKQYPPERLRPHHFYIPRPFSIIFRHSRSYSAPYTYSS